MNYLKYLLAVLLLAASINSLFSQDIEFVKNKYLPIVNLHMAIGEEEAKFQDVTGWIIYKDNLKDTMRISMHYIVNNHLVLNDNSFEILKIRNDTIQGTNILSFSCKSVIDEQYYWFSIMEFEQLYRLYVDTGNGPMQIIFDM
jgi:hypothetical protein